MNKTMKRALLIVGGVAVAGGVVWGILTLARNARRGNVDVYAVSDFSMTDYWGDTSQTSGMVSTDRMQKIFLSDTQKVKQVYVKEGQTVRKGDKLLSYDTTLTALDIERAQINYERQQLQQETAKKELERLLLAQNQEELQKQIEELQTKIDELIGKNQEQWYDENSVPIPSVTTVEGKATALQGDGSKEEPLYFNWNTEDPLSEENLIKLLPEEAEEAYVVLVIRKDNRSQHQPAAYITLRLELESGSPIAPEPDSSGAGTQSGTGADTGSAPADGPDTETGEGGQTTDAPVTSEQKLNYYYENLPGIEWQDPEVTTDEIRELQKELEELQKLLEESYPKEELIKMIRDKNKEIAQLDTSIKLAKVNLEKVKKEVGSDTVYSELEGTVKAVRDPNSGDFTGSEAVVEVSGGGGYYIDGALSELELGTVSIGGTVQVNSWMTGASCQGEIVEISDYPTDNANSWSDGNSNVSYYPFKVFVPEEANLQEGDWVEMSYQNTAGDDGNTMYLESMFIRSENGKSYVMARGENGKLEKRWVQTGRNLWGSYTQIRGGLTVDDFVAFPYGRNAVEGAGTTEATPDKLYNGM